MTRALTAEEKALRDKTKSKPKSKSPSSGGMKKDVQVKTHTRRTKSGKVTTVKAHTAKREAATKQTQSNGGRSSAKGKELKAQRLQKAEEVFKEEDELCVQYLETITEGTLKYKKGKDSFETLVNALSALCTKKKGKYGFSHEDAPIESVLLDTRRGFGTDFYKAVCSGVQKKLGASVMSAPSGVVKELLRNADTPVKFNRTKEIKRLSDKFNLYNHLNFNFDLKERMKELRESPKKLQREQKDHIKKY